MLTKSMFSQVPEELQLLHNDLLSIPSSFCFQGHCDNIDKHYLQVFYWNIPWRYRGRKKTLLPKMSQINSVTADGSRGPGERCGQWAQQPFKQNQHHLMKEPVSCNRKGTASKTTNQPTNNNNSNKTPQLIPNAQIW